jgi:hypothetical protein
MATQKFKLAVNNAEFPFLFQRAGRAVLQAGLDVAPRTSAAFVGGMERFDYNLAKLIYCENVLPTAEGIMSVGVQQDIAPRTPAVTHFDQMIVLRDSAERNFLMSPARGQNYVLSAATQTWTSYNSFSWSAANTLVTRAYVDGRTFICYQSDRVIEWDPTGLAFNTRALTLPAGYTMTDIRGIAGASNYLLLFTDTEILWSSTLDLLNFNDPIGKSGRQTPIDLKGQITCLVPISGGFVVYTNRNAVAAFFTNSADSPFSFREIQNSGGVAGYEQVTSDANQAEHYTYGSSGLQVVNLQVAAQIYPACSDFLSSRQYEAWDATAGEVVEQNLTGALEVKLQFLGNRYLVISYGKIAGQFTFALFHDVALKSWGKVRVNHVDVGVLPSSVIESFNWRFYELTGPFSSYTQSFLELKQTASSLLPLRSGFAFLQNTGAIQTLLADPAQDVGQGLAIFGHVQLTRSKTVTFLGATLDGVYANPVPRLRVLGSIPGNGYDRDKLVTALSVASTARSAKYVGNDVFENFDLAVEGKFVLTAGIVETMIHGSR